jgi:hypothetical protein
MIRKPGLLSREYTIGRRASYLNPVRMYVFTSAIFFLIFFSIIPFEDLPIKPEFNGTGSERIEKMDSLQFKEFVDGMNRLDNSQKLPYERKRIREYTDSLKGKGSGIRFSGVGYRSKAQYDSVLANGKRDNWLMRLLTYKKIELEEKYKGDNNQILKALVNNLVHSLPQLIFLTLPFFALVLRLLYIRRGQYYYVDHAIFTIHFFIMVFIVLLLIFSVNSLHDYWHWGIFVYLSTFLTIGIFAYLYRAMRNFYQQGRVKTILKLLLLGLANFIFVLILFMFFTILSLLKI